MSDTLIGQCACGAALTAWHLQNACPLTLQPSELGAESIEWLVRAYENRLDTTHVAVLGEN